MVMCCSLSVALSRAETVRMPSASISKVTSICGHAAGRRQYAVEHESADGHVVGGHLSFALRDVDLNAVLVIGRGSERLGLRGRDRCIARNEHGPNSAKSFDAQGEGRNVEEQDVFDLALQDAGLDGGAYCDDLVRIDCGVGLLAKNGCYLFGHGRHAGHASDEDDFIDFGGP